MHLKGLGVTVPTGCVSWLLLSASCPVTLPSRALPEGVPLRDSFVALCMVKVEKLILLHEETVPAVESHNEHHGPQPEAVLSPEHSPRVASTSCRIMHFHNGAPELDMVALGAVLREPLS